MGTDGPVIKLKKGVFMARGERVVAAADAAAFYEVTPRALLCAVARNRRRFTEQCMFRLERNKRSPLVFTEAGVAMLSAVLNSPKAVRINVEIVREVTRKMKEAGLSVWDMLTPKL
jgi:predicted nucleic acid-binding protein